MITRLQLADGNIEVLNTLRTTQRKHYHIPTDINNQILMYADERELRNYNRKFSCYNFDYSFRVTLEEDPKQFTEYVVMRNILAN